MRTFLYLTYLRGYDEKILGTEAMVPRLKKLLALNEVDLYT
jgi:hypothetical protein